MHSCADVPRYFKLEKNKIPKAFDIPEAAKIWGTGL